MTLFHGGSFARDVFVDAYGKQLKACFEGPLWAILTKDLPPPPPQLFYDLPFLVEEDYPDPDDCDPWFDD